MQPSNSLPSTPLPPPRNLRITFWGVQGSCPIFPNPYGIQEYSRRLAVYTLTKTFEDIRRKTMAGQVRIEDILGGPPTPEAIEAYQHRVGLPDLPFYGGETTCVEVETAEGNIIILDAGTGIRRCSIEIVSKWANRPERVLHLFGSHEHLDHRSGLTFSRFCYVDHNPFTIHVYGSYRFLHALDQHYGLFSRSTSELTYVDDPVDYKSMAASFKGVEFCCGDRTAAAKPRHWDLRDIAQPIRIGSTTVTPFEVCHAIPCCLGYKIEHNGKSFVFCTDHELRRGDPDDPRQKISAAAEERLCQHCANADVAYFDGQYFLDEYLGKKGIGSFPAVSRVDWGHGCVEDVIDRAIKCNIKHTFIGHHDPERVWVDRLDLDRHLVKFSEGKPYHIELADGDQMVEL